MQTINGSHTASLAVRGVLTGALSSLLTGPALAAEWSFTPDARVAVDYVDNPRYLVEGGQSDRGAVTELGAKLARRTENLDLSLAPSFRVARYRNDDDLDNETAVIAFALEERSEFATWSAQSTLLQDSTLVSELGTTGLTQTNHRHYDFSLGGGPQLQLSERFFASAQVNWSENRYHDAEGTGLVDYNYQGALVSAIYVLSERSDLSLIAHAGALEVPDQGTTTRDETLVLRLESKFGSRWATTLSAGPARVRTDFASDQGYVFGASLERRGEMLTLSAGANRSLTPTGVGVLTQLDEVSLSADQRLTERLSAGISVRASRNKSLLPVPGTGNTFEDVDFQGLEGRLSYQVSSQWSAQLALSGARQRGEFDPGSAESYRMLLSMVWNGRPHAASR